MSQKYFASKFFGDSDRDSKDSDKDVPSHAPRWSDDENFGDIPKSWGYSIPILCSVEPLAEPPTVSLNELVNTLSEGLSPNSRKVLSRRTAKLRNVKVIISQASSASTEDAMTSEHVSKVTASTGGRVTSPIPLSAKGKSRHPRDRPSEIKAKAD